MQNDVFAVPEPHFGDLYNDPNFNPSLHFVERPTPEWATTHAETTNEMCAKTEMLNQFFDGYVRRTLHFDARSQQRAIQLSVLMVAWVLSDEFCMGTNVVKYRVNHRAARQTLAQFKREIVKQAKHKSPHERKYLIKGVYTPVEWEIYKILDRLQHKAYVIISLDSCVLLTTYLESGRKRHYRKKH